MLSRVNTWDDILSIGTPGDKKPNVMDWPLMVKGNPVVIAGRGNGPERTSCVENFWMDGWMDGGMGN